MSSGTVNMTDHGLSPLTWSLKESWGTATVRVEPSMQSGPPDTVNCSPGATEVGFTVGVVCVPAPAEIAPAQVTRPNIVAATRERAPHVVAVVISDLLDRGATNRRARAL